MWKCTRRISTYNTIFLCYERRIYLRIVIRNDVCVIVCAGAAGDTATAELMSRRVDETVRGIRWSNAERDMVGSFVTDRWRTVAKMLRRTAGRDNNDRSRRRCRLIVYEVLYVKYGAAKWPEDALHAVLAGERLPECPMRKKH